MHRMNVHFIYNMKCVESMDILVWSYIDKKFAVFVDVWAVTVCEVVQVLLIRQANEKLNAAKKSVNKLEQETLIAEALDVSCLPVLSR